MELASAKQKPSQRAIRQSFPLIDQNWVIGPPQVAREMGKVSNWKTGLSRWLASITIYYLASRNKIRILLSRKENAVDIE